ncbi:MAG: ABC transporter permease [Planctomycetota bacterium]
MLGYIARRLLLMIPTLIGVTAVVFLVMAYSPGGFGGVSSDAEGNRTASEEARRQQQLMKARFGYDLPKPVQYLRWLNQVSPAGFAMSSQLAEQALDADPAVNPDADPELSSERAAALAVIEAAPRVQSEIEREQLLLQALRLAMYRDTPAEVAAQELVGLMSAPEQALRPPGAPESSADDAQRDLLDKINAVPEDAEDSRRKVTGAPTQDAMRKALLGEIDFHFTGLNRVRFDTPTFGWPDLGKDLERIPVLDAIRDALPVTLLLNALTIPLIYVISIVAGVYAARGKGGWFDTGSGVFFLALWSFPVIGAGVLLVSYLASDNYLPILPTAGLSSPEAAEMAFLPRWVEDADGRAFERGWLLDRLWHLAGPVFCLTYGGFAVLTKIMRGAVLDNLHADFARTARAKGVAPNEVLWRHVVRNSLLPMLTIVSNLLPALLVGSVVVERIFSIPGMGDLAVRAAFSKDQQLLMGTTLMISAVVLVSELLRDLLYAVADPRVSYD